MYRMHEFIIKNNLISISEIQIPANGTGDSLQMCYCWKTKRYLEVLMCKNLRCMRSCERHNCNCAEYENPIINKIFSLKKGLKDPYWGEAVKFFHFNNDLYV